MAWVKSIPGGFITSNQKISAIKVWNVSKTTPVRTFRVGQCGILNLTSMRTTNIDKEAFLISFNNGSVGVLNFSTKKLEFLSESNHSETVFDVSFKTSERDVLATSSYDGSVRIWDFANLKCINTL